MKNIILAIIICGCLTIVTFTRCNHETVSALSSEDIEKFIKDNNIEPLGVNTIYGFNTVFIVGNLYYQEYYEVYKIDDVVTQGRKVTCQGDWSEIGPIVFSGGTASGDYPFAVLYILDDDLVNTGYYIEIIGADGSSKIGIDKKAYAIETIKLGTIMSYKVIDSKGEIIIDEMSSH